MTEEDLMPEEEITLELEARDIDNILYGLAEERGDSCRTHGKIISQLVEKVVE